MEWSDIGGWFSNNSDWIEPLAKFGLGAYQNSQKSTARNDYADLLQNAEKQNYNQYLNEYNAYADYVKQAQDIANQNAGIAAGNRAASRSAAMQTEAARQKAAKRAQKKMNSSYEAAKSLFQSYAESGKRVLPMAEGAYAGGTQGLDQLMKFFMTPERMKLLSGSMPAYEVPLKLPSSLRGGA